MVNRFLKRPIRREAAGQTIHSQAPHDTKIRMTSTIKIPSMNAAMLRGRREAARGWHSLIRRRERKELRPWSFISALWAGDDGVVVIVHRHRYVRLPTLRTTASDGYDHIFGHITLQARKPSRDHLTTSARGLGFMGERPGRREAAGPSVCYAERSYSTGLLCCKSPRRKTRFLRRCRDIFAAAAYIGDARVILLLPLRAVPQTWPRHCRGFFALAATLG